MSIPIEIFKSYDIRGVVRDSLTPEVVEAIGRSYVEYSGAKRIAIGHDMRIESPMMVEALIKGIVAMGSSVVDVGLCSSPMLYHTVGMNDDIDGGLMVTASHNPVGWNGVKMVLGDVSPIGMGSGMEEIRDGVVSSDFVDAVQKGSVEKIDSLKEYLDGVFEYVGDVDIADLKIVADAGNGMMGMMLPEMEARLGIKFDELYWDLDGMFPNHPANPLNVSTLVDLQKRVVDIGADFGFAYDADGDRIGLVDELGVVVSGDVITALVSRYLLKKKPGALICGDVCCGRDLKRFVEEDGGRFVVTPVGHAYIKKIMRETGAYFAGEISAHLYYSDFYYVESCVLSTLLLIKLIRESGKKVSELVLEVSTHSASGELNFNVDDKNAVIDLIKDEMMKREGAVLSEIDGIRVDFPTWWFGVRASNTEPVLRLNVEAVSDGEMEKERDALVLLIKGAGGILE